MDIRLARLNDNLINL